MLTVDERALLRLMVGDPTLRQLARRAAAITLGVATGLVGAAGLVAAVVLG